MKNTFKKYWYIILISLIVLLGIYLRFRGIWSNTSLWCDECALAINVRFKKFTELFGVLYCLQVAPPFFLIATKVLTAIFGFKESVFRFIPFLAGCSSIIAFYFLATKTLNKKFSIIIALSVFVINQQLINYSFEFKPYILDVFFTIILLMFFINFDIEKSTIKKSFLNGCLISIIPWTSFTSLIVIAGGCLYLVFNKFKSHLREKFFLFFPILISFFIYANVSLIDNYLNSGMINYWGNRENSFLTLNQHSLFLIKNVVNFFFTFSLNNEIYLLTFALILFTLGLIMFFKEKKSFIIISTISFILCATASLLKFYPFFERFVLFLLPMLIIIIIKPLDIISWNKKIKSLIIFLLILPIVFSQVITLKDFSKLKKISKHGEHPRELMQIMLNNLKPGDKIFINQNSLPSANFYFYYFYPLRSGMQYKSNMNEKMTIDDYKKILKTFEKGYYWIYLASDYSKNNQMDQTIINWAKTQQTLIKMYQNEQSILLYVYVK